MEAKMAIYNSTIGIQIFNYKHYLKNKFTVQKGKKTTIYNINNKER